LDTRGQTREDSCRAGEARHADATPHAVKRVLYYSARRALAVEFSRAMAEVAECRSRRGAAGPVVCCGPVAFEFVVKHDVGSALQALHQQFFNLVLLDLREPVRPGRRRRTRADFERGLELLDAMDREPDISAATVPQDRGPRVGRRGPGWMRASRPSARGGGPRDA
jgi:CheY-like chemotaxis protein